jgi:CPA1 family monovalent cation:H+ antiporter
LAGVMTLPLLAPDGSAFPARELAIFLAAAVIVLSLVMASIGLPRTLKGLVLPAESADQVEEDRARHDAAIAAIAAIEKAQQGRTQQTAGSEIYIHAAAYVLALYRHRLESSATSPGEAVQLRATEEAERSLRLTALQAEREKIFSLARHSQISNQISRKLVREIDLFESRYR